MSCPNNFFKLKEKSEIFFYGQAGPYYREVDTSRNHVAMQPQKSKSHGRVINVLNWGISSPTDSFICPISKKTKTY